MNKEVDESAKEEQLQNEIDFLETMRFNKSDAIKDPEHCKKCCDSFTRGRDRGRLTLVHAKYFDLGEQIMKKAHSTFTLDILRQSEKVEDNAKKKVINEKLLMDEFCKLCVDFKPLSMEQKKKVFLELLDKVANTTFSDKLRIFRAESTARGSIGNEDNLTTRQQMDATAAENKKKRMKKAASTTKVLTFDEKSVEPKPELPT